MTSLSNGEHIRLRITQSGFEPRVGLINTIDFSRMKITCVLVQGILLHSKFQPNQFRSCGGRINIQTHTYKLSPHLYECYVIISSYVPVKVQLKIEALNGRVDALKLSLRSYACN